MSRHAAFDAGQIEGLSVRALIDMRAASTPDAVFLVDPTSGQTTSYRELRDLCLSVVARINQHGVKPGEAVAFALTNGPASAICVLAIMYGGYLATAVNLVALFILLSLFWSRIGVIRSFRSQANNVPVDGCHV